VQDNLIKDGGEKGGMTMSVDTMATDWMESLATTVLPPGKE
jgi:hypothetical protein